MLRTITSSEFQKKARDSNLWKEIINHRKYVGPGLKWCTGDGIKVRFWRDNWFYMVSLVSFVDDDNLQYITRRPKTWGSLTNR